LIGASAMNLSPAGQRVTRARHDDEPERPLERPRVVVSNPRRRPPSRDPLRGMRMKVRM
jgi:hypothetical protein